MTNSGLPKLIQMGEKYIIDWLTENGYCDIIKEPLQLNQEGFMATGKLENILVQARFFLHPHKPYKLSDYEMDLLTRRAIKLGSIAYAAYLVLDEAGKLVNEIIWERLV